MEEFPEIFFISCDQDSSIAGLLQFNNGMKHWDLHFSRPVQAWELDSLDRFIDLIYSSSVSGRGMTRWVGSLIRVAVLRKEDITGFYVPLI